jgi:hypothetical protein
MSVLATVEVQLVLRCLDIRSRLTAARCNKRQYAAASHPFAWPQDQLMNLRVENDPAALQSLGQRLRRCLLRLSSIRLGVQFQNGIPAPLCPEIFAVPNVHAITALPKVASPPGASDFLLSLLHHLAAQQLRLLDIYGFWEYECSAAELLQLSALPHLHSLFLGTTIAANFPPSLPQSSVVFPSLAHLSLNLQNAVEETLPLFSLLSPCPRLTSLELECANLSTELIGGLAQLPLLQRLKLSFSWLAESATNAWTAVRSLREIELDRIYDAPPLLSVLHSIPTLRLLRWHCRIPQFVEVPPYLPRMSTLDELMRTAPLLRVELIMPRTFDEWYVQRRYLDPPPTEGMRIYQRQAWNELQPLGTELPRVSIVIPNPKDELAHE